MKLTYTKLSDSRWMVKSGLHTWYVKCIKSTVEDDPENKVKYVAGEYVVDNGEDKVKVRADSVDEAMEAYEYMRMGVQKTVGPTYLLPKPQSMPIGSIGRPKGYTQGKQTQSNQPVQQDDPII